MTTVAATVARPLPTLLLAVGLAGTALLMAGCAEAPGAFTRLEIGFGGQKADADWLLGFVADERAAQHHYERDGLERVDGYTVHDQLEEWSVQTRKTYAATSYPDTGFGAGYFVTAIDGVVADGASAYWALTINGQPSELGMSQALLSPDDVVRWTYTSLEGDGAPGDGPALAIDPLPAPLREETLTLTGTATPGSTVSWDAHDATGLPVGDDGRWTLSRPVSYGSFQAAVMAYDDSGTITRASTPVTRLAPATFNVLYTAQPGHPASSHEVWYNPDMLASASMYEGTATERATTFSVHDLMVAWTAQTGVPIVYGGPGAFGFSVESIDGIGQPLSSSLPPYWCYTLNGETADLGISLQTVAPGDVLEWEYSTCV